MGTMSGVRSYVCHCLANCSEIRCRVSSRYCCCYGNHTAGSKPIL